MPPPNAPWWFTPEHGPLPSREHARFSLFSANWGGAGWHMFLPLAIALHTLDRQEWRERWEKSPTASEQAHLLRKQLPNTLCKVVLKFGVDISDISTPKMSQKTIKMSTWKWHPNARCPTHRVKVVRYAAMQFMHLSRDIQRYVVISLKSREHSRTTPIAVAILKLWNFISGLVVLGHGEEVPRSSFDPSFFPNPFLVSPIPACIPYSPCNHGHAINRRCGNCTRNKRRRPFDGWNRHLTSRPRMLVGASTGCRSCTCSDHSSASATYTGRWHWPTSGRNRCREGQRGWHMPGQRIRWRNPKPVHCQHLAPNFRAERWQWTHESIWQTWPWRET